MEADEGSEPFEERRILRADKPRLSLDHTSVSFSRLADVPSEHPVTIYVFSHEQRRLLLPSESRLTGSLGRSSTCRSAIVQLQSKDFLFLIREEDTFPSAKQSIC
jgi:hypothetical protein